MRRSTPARPTPTAAQRRWRWLALWLAVAGPAAGDGPAPQTLPSVASTDLCSDLVLLQVAAPGQIRSVSSAAADPAMSPLAAQARAYPANRGRVEELLHLAPDVALVYQGWTGRGHRDLLAARGIRVVALPYPSGWDQALATLRATATAIGRAEQGAALTGRAERRMQALAARTPPYRVLYLRPNGGSAGHDTYVDDLLRRLGLRNLAAEHGLRGWGRFPLEQLVATPPDLFLLGYFGREQAPAQSGYARHPLFAALLARTPQVRVPAGGWGCGGVEMVAVAEQIVAHIEALPGPGGD